MDLRYPSTGHLRGRPAGHRDAFHAAQTRMAPSGSAHDMSPLFLGSMRHVPHAAVWHGPLRTTCTQHNKTPPCLLPIRPLPQWCTQRCMLCAFTSNITLTRTPPATAATQKQVLSNTPTQHPFPNTPRSNQEPQHHFWGPLYRQCRQE